MVEQESNLGLLNNLPEGESSQFTPSNNDNNHITRRKAIKIIRNLGLSVAGLSVGYELANVLGLSNKVAETVFEDDIKDYIKDRHSLVSLGMFGQSNEVFDQEAEMGIPIYGQSDFITMHGGGDSREYIDRKIDKMAQFVGRGKIPGISFRPSEAHSNKFSYGSKDLYDERHKDWLLYFAEKVKDLKVPVEISFYEPNITKEPPEKYADFFNYTVRLFKKNGTHNAVFGMYMSGQFPFTRGMMPDYYPGHDMIDLFGISLYDLYLENLLHFHHWFPGKQGPVTLAWPWLKLALDVTDGQTAVYIAEAGSGRNNDEEAADWIMGLIALSAILGVEIVRIFNVNFSGKYSGNVPQTIEKFVRKGAVSSKINWGERDWRPTRNSKRKKAHKNQFATHSDLIDYSDSLVSRIRKLSSTIKRDDIVNADIILTAEKIDNDLFRSRGNMA